MTHWRLYTRYWISLVYDSKLFPGPTFKRLDVSFVLPVYFVTFKCQIHQLMNYNLARSIYQSQLRLSNLGIVELLRISDALGLGLVKGCTHYNYMLV